MMSAKDLANKFSARKADTDRTAEANALYEESLDNAVGYTTAADWLNDYKDSVKKHLVPTSNKQSNELENYIAEKILEDQYS